MGEWVLYQRATSQVETFDKVAEGPSTQNRLGYGNLLKLQPGKKVGFAKVDHPHLLAFERNEEQVAEQEIPVTTSAHVAVTCSLVIII